MIDSKDISVIVQGPIAYSSDGKVNQTKLVCESIRTCLPEAEIILSTWEGSYIADIEADKFLLNPSIHANKMYRIGEKEPTLHTVNHQIITTIEGLKQATKKYAIKTRTDVKFLHNNFLKYFDKYNRYPSDEEYRAWRVFDKRIVTLPTVDVRGERGLPYNVSDWFYLGLTNDLIKLFDIPLIDTFNLVSHGNDYPHAEDNLGNEQAIWVSCLRKYRDVDFNNSIDLREKTKRESEIALANNFVIVSGKDLGLYSFKYGMNSYLRNPLLSIDTYTHNDWKKLYNKYGGGEEVTIFRSYEIIFKLLYKYYKRFSS